MAVSLPAPAARARFFRSGQRLLAGARKGLARGFGPPPKCATIWQQNGSYLAGKLTDSATPPGADSPLYPHYLLGRSLALEAMVRELLPAVPMPQRTAIASRLLGLADVHRQMADAKAQAGQAGAAMHAMHCGVFTTIQKQAFGG